MLVKLILIAGMFFEQCSNIYELIRGKSQVRFTQKRNNFYGKAVIFM